MAAGGGSHAEEFFLAEVADVQLGFLQGLLYGGSAECVELLVPLMLVHHDVNFKRYVVSTLSPPLSTHFRRMKLGDQEECERSGQMMKKL